MRMMRYCFMLLTLLLTLALQAQTDDGASAQLAGMGFENVRVKADGGVVYAAFEDPTYRGTYRGFGVVLEQLAQHYAAKDSFEVVVLDTKIPRVCVHARRDGGNWQLAVDYEVAEAMAALGGDGRARKLVREDRHNVPSQGVDRQPPPRRALRVCRNHSAVDRDHTVARRTDNAAAHDTCRIRQS